jgi:hypothetical protein
VRKGEVFTRPGPNIFGLIELGHANEPDSEEPPADFGHENAVSQADLDAEGIPF